MQLERTHPGSCHCGRVRFEVDLPDGLVGPPVEDIGHFFVDDDLCMGAGRQVFGKIFPCQEVQPVIGDIPVIDRNEMHSNRVLPACLPHPVQATVGHSDHKGRKRNIRHFGKFRQLISQNYFIHTLQ